MRRNLRLVAAACFRSVIGLPRLFRKVLVENVDFILAVILTNTILVTNVVSSARCSGVVSAHECSGHARGLQYLAMGLSLAVKARVQDYCYEQDIVTGLTRRCRAPCLHL